MCYYFAMEKFIHDIMSRPALWMLKHPERKNKLRLKVLWDEIKKKYPDHTVNDLKKRWKNLKDSYRKELKRVPQSRPGVPADNLKSCWRYFDSMSFLKDEFGLKNKELEDANHSQTEQDKYIEAMSQSPGSPASSKSDEEESQPGSALKRKVPGDLQVEMLKIERKKMKILEEEVARNNEYTKSDNYHFLMSLLPEMDKLPPLQKLRLRTKISQAVLDEVSMTVYEDQQNFSEIQEPIQYQEPADTVSLIKEEAINMYD